MKSVRGYWFSENDRLPHGDGRIIKVGRTHKVKGDIELCCHGLHASRKPLEALVYAPGNVCWGVELSGTIIECDDKLVASERTYLWRVDAEEVLRRFARKCALDVIHRWDAPDVVVRYLKTGDEGLRASAWASASASARASAWDSARDSARASARASAWDSDSFRHKQNHRLVAMLAAERGKGSK